MADDWMPGDLALRVKNGSWSHSRSCGPKPGGVYTVEWVVTCNASWRPEYGTQGLVLEGYQSPSPGGAYDAKAFRKIKPLTEQEREEALRELKEPVNG